MTIRDDVLGYLQENPTATATQISRELEYKLSSVSSTLKKLCIAGWVRRVKGFGPRGGYGYELNAD